MVGDKLKKNKVVIIYSTIELVNGNSAGSARTMNYARALSSSCDVIILTFIRLKNISNENLIEIEPGIYTCGNKAKNNKFISKLFYYINIIYFLKSIVKLLTEVGDSKQKALLFYPTVEVFIDYMTVAYIIKYKKLSVVYESNEVRKYSTDFEINPLSYNSKFQRIKYGYSEKLTRYFSGLICISTNIENYFIKYNHNIIRIPILSNINNIKKSEVCKFQSGDIFKMRFFGSVSYYKENLNEFLQCLKILKIKNNSLKFVVEFYGPIDNISSEKLNASIVELQLDEQVFYRGKLNQREVNENMQKCHLLVIPRGESLQNHYGFSTKLSEYLSSGVPCFVTDVSDNALYIKDDVNGFIVEPNNIYAFVQKLSYIIFNYNDIVENITKNSFITVKDHFLYSNYSKQLDNFLCSKN